MNTNLLIFFKKSDLAQKNQLVFLLKVGDLFPNVKLILKVSYFLEIEFESKQHIAAYQVK